MKRFAWLLTVLVLAALLYGSATPAQACSCEPEVFEDPAFSIGRVDAIVIGHVTEVNANFDGGHVVFAVERYLKGHDADVITVRAGQGLGDCALFTQNTKVGEQRRLLGLHAVDEAVYQYSTGACSLYTGQDSLDDSVRFLDGYLGSHKDVPWVPIVALAFAVPVAVLVVPSFFMRRGGSGH